MADFPTEAQLFAIGRQAVLVANPRLAVDAVDRDGSDAQAMVAAMAAIGGAVVGQQRRLWADLWRGTAKKDALRRLVADRYNITAKDASVAYVTLTFTIPSANTSPFVIPAKTQAGTADGRKFETTEPVTFPLGATSVSAVATSVLPGLAQQVRKETIRSILSTIVGAPDGMTVNNPVASAGAADAETDEELNARVDTFLNGLGGGSAAAVIAAALAVPGVISAAAFETLSSSGLADYFSTLVIADKFTDDLIVSAPNGSPTYDVQAAAFTNAVYARLSGARPLGAPLRVILARPRLLPIRLALTFSANIDGIGGVETATQRALAAVVTYTNQRDPGQPWVRASALTALQGIPGLLITGQEIAFPAGNVVPQQYEVIRTSMALTGLV